MTRTFTSASLGPRAERFELTRGTDRLSFREFVHALQQDADVRRRLGEAIAGTPWPAVFWEVAPMSAATMDAPLQFVVLDAPTLAGVSAQRGPFSSHLDGAGDAEVRTFDNLGGDARLVVPTGPADSMHHAHLAGFLRSGTSTQIDRLWHAVGDAVAARLQHQPAPVWLSTSGLGVSWVHVRLDGRPKYYQHAPYRRAP